MLTVRLPEDLERALERLAEVEGTTKTRIVRQALERYLHERREERSAFELGEDLFGRYGSGDGTRSTRVREGVRVRLHAKRAR